MGHLKNIFWNCSQYLKPIVLSQKFEICVFHLSFEEGLQRLVGHLGFVWKICKCILHVVALIFKSLCLLIYNFFPAQNFAICGFAECYFWWSKHHIVKLKYGRHDAISYIRTLNWCVLTHRYCMTLKHWMSWCDYVSYE